MSGDVFLFPDPDAGLSWARVGARGGKVKIAAPGARAPGSAGGDRITLLAPGEDVAVRAVDLPVRSEAQARAAAAFAVEDLIAQPLDAVHVIAGPRAGKSGRRLVAAVDRDVFAAWRAALADVGLAPDHITPDFMAVPAAEGEIAVVDLGDRVLARGPGVGFAVESGLAADVLAATLAAAPDAALRLWTDRVDALVSREARAGRDVEVEPRLDGDALARLFQRGLDAGLAVDLAEADAAPSAGFAVDWRRWRVAAGLALAAAASYAALMLVQIAALDRQTDAAYAEASELMRAAFPDMQRIVNPRAQLRARVGESGGAANAAAFLALSGLVADSVREIDTLEVESVRFDAARAELDVSVRHAGYADVERLSAAVAARGGVVEEGGSRAAGDLMVSDLVVRARR